MSSNEDMRVIGYLDMRKAILKFINDSGISAYDICRISKDLCCCRTCRFFVQHYAKDGKPVDFGHCIKGNVFRSKNPNMQSCGFWSLWFYWSPFLVACSPRSFL